MPTPGLMHHAYQFVERLDIGAAAQTDEDSDGNVDHSTR
jgi:hypothetical protein